MAMFGAMGSAAARLPYEELLKLQQMGQAQNRVNLGTGHSEASVMGPGPTPGIGEGLPRSSSAPSGMFAARQQSSPDYGAHYMMHGRDEHGGLPQGPKRNLGQKILKGVGDFALAWAASNGDPMAQHTMQMRMKERAGRKQAEAEFQQHNALVQNLMRRGISADDAELYALNPEKLSEELNSRFRTREASEGETIRTPGMGSQPDNIWTAPKTFNNGPDVVRYDPQSGMAAPIYQGPTDAQRALAESGIQPGTPEAYRFMRDMHLDGQGPTAVEMQQQRLGQSDLNNRRSTGVSRENSVRSAGVSERNSIRSSEASRYSVDNRPQPRGRSAPNAGGTRIRNPKTGETMVLRNGQWVKE